MRRYGTTVGAQRGLLLGPGGHLLLDGGRGRQVVAGRVGLASVEQLISHHLSRRRVVAAAGRLGLFGCRLVGCSFFVPLSARPLALGAEELIHLQLDHRACRRCRRRLRRAGADGGGRGGRGGASGGSRSTPMRTLAWPSGRGCRRSCWARRFRCSGSPCGGRSACASACSSRC